MRPHRHQSRPKYYGANALPARPPSARLSTSDLHRHFQCQALQARASTASRHAVLQRAVDANHRLRIAVPRRPPSLSPPAGPRRRVCFRNPVVTVRAFCPQDPPAAIEPLLCADLGASKSLNCRSTAAASACQTPGPPTPTSSWPAARSSRPSIKPSCCSTSAPTGDWP